MSIIAAPELADDQVVRPDPSPTGEEKGCR
jgi:hypothetical protein